MAFLLKGKGFRRQTDNLNNTCLDFPFLTLARRCHKLPCHHERSARGDRLDLTIIIQILVGDYLDIFKTRPVIYLHEGEFF